MTRRSSWCMGESFDRALSDNDTEPQVRSCLNCRHIKKIVHPHIEKEYFCTCSEYLRELDEKPEFCNPDYPRWIDYGTIAIDPFNCGMKFWEPAKGSGAD